MPARGDAAPTPALRLRLTEAVVHDLGRLPERLVVVFHITPNSVHFLELLGRSFTIERIVAIPYSSRLDVVASLAREYPVTVPSTLDEIPSLVLEALGAAGDGALILEIGGYCRQIAVRDDLCIGGIVEDTTQGHRGYKFAGSSLRCPVISVARTRIKELEAHAIGPAVVHAVEQVLRTHYDDSLRGRRVTVLGYGDVGGGLAQTLRAGGAVVSVFDTSAYKCVKALHDGFAVPARSAALATAEVIIGASGFRSLADEDLDLLRDDVVLASASSKQVEFDVDAILARGTITEHGHVSEVRGPRGRMRLVQRGYPVNFLGASVPSRLIDLNYSEIALALAEVPRRHPGFHEDFGAEDELCTRWMQLYDEPS